MACDVVAINSGGSCIDAEGGITHSYVVSLEYITAVTATGNVISAITMGTPNKWMRLDYDKDGTAFFNQTGQRNGRRLSYLQQAFLKFAGYDETYGVAANTFGKCCQLVFIHVLTNGKRVVQGIELDTTATGNFTATKIADTKATPNLMTDTSENEARLEFNIEGTAKSTSPFTTLTDAAIEAL